MLTFNEFLIKEVDAPPMGGPPGGSLGTPVGGGGPMPPGGAPPGPMPMGGGGMPPMPGAPPGGGMPMGGAPPAPTAPADVKQIKAVDVWSVLEKIMHTRKMENSSRQKPTNPIDSQPS